MAERKSQTTDPLTQDEQPPVATLEETMPPPPVLTHSRTWTLNQAFSVLRQALALHYQQSDNMPSHLACQELQAIYDNGGELPTHPNCLAAWRQIVPLLEQALGTNLRAS